MDHHRRHNSHPHLHAHSSSSRYAPFPPQQPPPAAPVFLAPDPYRRQPHLSFPPQQLLSVALPPPPPAAAAAAAHHRHQHRPDNGRVVYVSYAPSSSRASDDHGRLLALADPPDRLVHKAPHPPVPALRVSDRIIFPEGHPEAARMHHQPRRSSTGEAFFRADFKRERVRVLDEGQGGVPYGRREGLAVDLAEHEDVASGLGPLGRKRPRWEEGRALGEDTMLECFLQERDPKRLTSGASGNRRLCDIVYDLRAVDAESSRASTCVIPSERGQAMLAFPRQPAEMSVRSSSVYSVSKLELLGKSPMMESETIALGSSHGFHEKNFAGRSKRYVFGGEEEVHSLPKKALPPKPSVLSRIQFAKPVYKRKCEQEIITTMSPLPVSQTLAFSEGKSFEADVPAKLDVSFKSDVLVAKEILLSSVSASPRCIGEVCGGRTTKKNAAKVTAVSPGTSFSKSESKVTTTHTHKLKIREERCAHLHPGGKPNKERASKVEKKVLASSNSSAPNLDDEVTVSRTPRNRKANQVSVSSHPVKNSMGRVSPVRMTEKEMAEKVVVLPDAGLRSDDGKIPLTRSPKRQPSNEILVQQGNATVNPNDRNPIRKIPKLLISDGVITTGRCPEEKLAREILVNSTKAEPRTGGTLNSTGSTGKKLAKEMVVTQKANLLHCIKKVASVDGPKKEVLDNISLPSVAALPNAEANIIERPEEKPDKDTVISPSSVINSAKKITTMRTLKKKTIKRNQKKKVVAASAPCLPSTDPPGEISKGHESTNSSVNGIDLLEKIPMPSSMNCSHMDRKNLKEENRAMQHSETVQEVSTSGSSSESKDLEDCAKLVSGYSEGMASSTVRALDNKATKKKNTEELTLIPCTFDSCPVQEVCGMPLVDRPHENPMHSKEVQRGSLSNCFQKYLSCSGKAHKDTLHSEEVQQGRLDAGEVHSGSIPDSCQDVGHLKKVHDSTTKPIVCLGADFHRKGQEQHTMTSSHNDVIYPVLLGKAETFDVGKLAVGKSTPELHLQRVMLPGDLETEIIETSSNTTVQVEVDSDESPKKKNSIKNAAENFKNSVQQEESRGDGNVNLREESGSGKHFSATKEKFPPDTVCGKKLHDDFCLGGELHHNSMAFFDGESSFKADIPSGDGESSFKADISSGNRDEGQKLSPRPQSSAVLEEVETVCCEKDAIDTTVLHCPMQGRSVSLRVEAQSPIPDMDKEIKQKKSPAEGVIFAEIKFSEVDGKNNIAGGERSGEDMVHLPIKAQDAVLNSNLLMETNGQDSGVRHMLSIDAFPQPSPSVVGAECPVVNSMAEQVAYRVHSSPLNVAEENYPEDLATVSEEMHYVDLKQTVCDVLDCKSCHNVSILENSHGDFNIKKDCPPDSTTLSVAELKICGKSDLMNLSEKTLSLETLEAEKQFNHQVTGKEKLTGVEVCERPGISKIYPNQKSLSTRTFKKPPSHSVRHNKWYRTENPPVLSSSRQMRWPGRSSLLRQSPKKLGKAQSSYIRKGNSLIRKSLPTIPLSHPYPEQTALDQICLPETDKNMSVEDKIVSADRFNFSSTKILSSSFERPKTPPLPVSTKSNHSSLSSPQTLTEDPLSEPGGEDNAIPLVGTQALDLNEENHSTISTEESKVSGKKKLIYVKHRSNQLIASPAIDANNTSRQTTEEGPALPFASTDIYYRNNNKLIRDTSLSNGQLKQETSLASDCSDSKCHHPSKMSPLRDGAKVPRKARLEKAMEKTHKQSRFSLVWTLNGSQSQNDRCSNVLKHQKVLPFLFPWKRTTYWRDFITKMGSNKTKHSLSLISSKLRLARQRDTIYTISNSGFSLRKSGVLSVSGSNLKWSKSMERRSRKASEEATAAIVEHERKKKKLKGTTCADLNMKSDNCSQRERIFRVGTIHYKMDSSRRTLVRIPDEQTPAITNSRFVRGPKMPIVPRRLLIGNDEYVRVGNGNQLVRDPKKLVRILANEKIRWSLHTARLRSVRKQQYCQFFTRFGKCNKEDGKCPYIHDPTKIAICTKFLKGLCSSPNCKLTHKVIPERMPDCSYFLQGLCTNMSCPYRHVNVNPKASVCEGFLKGYCMDGDECRKKHRYVCPYFEASGECPQGATCKLHHPKRANKQANKSRKRKRSPIREHVKGRYFGCSVAEASDSHVFASSTDMQRKDEDIFFHKGRFAEYVSLDIDTDDDDAVELNALMDSHPILMDSDLSDSQSSDADALIKPIRIMNMDLR